MSLAWSTCTPLLWASSLPSPLRGYAIFAPSSFREIQRATDRGTVITLSGTGNTFRDTDLADYLRACPGPGVCS